MIRIRMQEAPLWIQIYLMAFGLITLVIFCISYQFIEASSRHNIQREYNRSLDKHVMFASAMIMYAGSVEKMAFNPGLKHEMLKSAAQNYGRYYTDDKSYIAMIDPNGETLYSSISKEDDKIMDLVPPKDGRRSFVIRKLGSRSVLFVSGWVTIADQLFRLDYENDITDVVAEQKALAIQIAIWFLAGMVLVAVGLFILIKVALQPLAQVSRQATAMATGNYEHRILIKRGGEIGQLAVEFNHMADAVLAHMELLRQEVKEREVFIASLSHELKTPLTSIMGYANLLQNYHLEPSEMQKALCFIHAESKRLDEMSKRLLDLFRIGSGKVLHKKQVPVSALLEQLEIISKFSLTRKNQTLEIKSSVMNLTVDQELFLILLNNLIENASKASASGTSIDLHVYAEGTFVVFCVEDHGCGIPEEHLGHVFQPFFMLNSARDKKNGGHGLGLSLCKAIVEAHGGSISIESSPGEGTKVCIQVPAGQVFAKH